eukprot:gene31736-41191_t
MNQIELAQEAKNAASVAWNSGNYEVAIDQFSKAISFIPSPKSSNESKELSKILYSNRSAALLKEKRIAEALQDANKCIEIDQTWAKGYARKGDALLANKLATDAYNAYNSGLRMCPNDSVLTEKSEQAMRVIRNSTSSSSSSSSSSNTSAYRSSGTKTISTMVKEYAKIGCLIASFCYLIPFSRSFSTNSYRAAVASSILSNLLAIFSKHGWPKFTTAYSAEVFSDQHTMTAFMALILLFSKPYLIALAAVFIQEVIYFLPDMLQYLQQSIPLVRNSIQPLLSRYLPTVSLDNVFALFNPNRAAYTQSVLLSMSAQCEVMQGCFLIIELLLPSRNPLMLYLWWQYLQMRYLLDQSGSIKRAFTAVDASILQLISHRMCPELIRKGYGLLKGFMAQQIASKQGTASQTQSSGSGGIRSMLSKCTVM